jgi:hypothetical protein
MKGKLQQTTIEFHDGHKELSWAIQGHRCDNCEEPLENIMQLNDCIQPSDALEIAFHPYYGGYFDKGSPEESMHDRAYRMFWLCEKCADSLIKRFPCFQVPR